MLNRSSLQEPDLLHSGLEHPPDTRLQPITLAVCSNRLERVRGQWVNYINTLRSGDELLIVLDVEEDESVKALAGDLTGAGVRVVLNRKNLGLSESRNLVLEKCRTRYLLFVDDDVALTADTVNSIRGELCRGANIVGVRIDAPQIYYTSMPWFMSKGQLHYLAIHNPQSQTFSTWGACMGLDLRFVKDSTLIFRVELGRRGNSLQSGDDTTFLREMKLRGAKETFLKQAYVVHNIDDRRVSVSYMLRRSYWQGRSEFRRRDSINGLKKEWNRFLASDTRPAKKISLAVFYSTALLVGMSIEFLEVCRGSHRR